MKKLLLLLLLLVPSICFGFGANSPSSFISSSSSGYDTTDITLWWRAESATFVADLDYTAGASTTTYSGCTHTTAAGYGGTTGLDCDSAGDDMRFTSSVSDVVTGASGRVGFWFRAGQLTTDTNIMALYDDASNLIQVHLTTTDNNLKFEFVSVGTYRGSAISSTNSITIDTWHFVEFAWNVTANIQKIYIDGVEDGSDTTTLVDFSATTLTLYFGDNGAGLAGDNHFDHIIATKDHTKELFSSRYQVNYDGS